MGKGPSRTARKVALNLVTLGSRRGMEKVLPPGLVDATARLLVESGAVDRLAVRFSRSRTAVGIYLAFDWMMPGQFEAFAHRKAFFERQVRSGIEAGATRVLVLGAGYDTLGWRLAPVWSIRPEDLGPFLEQTGWTIAPEHSSGAGIEYFGVAVQ